MAIFIGKMMGIQYFFLAHRKLEFPMKNADFPWRKVQFTKLENGDYPRKKCDFPLKKWWFPYQKWDATGTFLASSRGPCVHRLGLQIQRIAPLIGSVAELPHPMAERKTNQEAAEVAKHHVKKKKLDTLW